MSHDPSTSSTSSTTTTLAAGAARPPVAVLGLGPMGRAIAAALLGDGHPTAVWNRTPGKAGALVASGASLASTPEDAAHRSAVLVVCVIDDDAAEAILTPAAAALAGKTVVNLTSGAPAGARRLAQWAAAHDVDYVDGAILTPAPSIGSPEAVILYAGPTDVYERTAALRSSLGGTSVYLGADPGSAAANDLALLDIFWTAMTGIVHGFALARAEGIRATALAELAQGVVGLLPDIVADFASRADRAAYSGDTSAISSAHASLLHIARAARDRGLNTGALDAALALTRRAIDGGHGGDSYARITELVAAP